jgi:hypothetical protein
MGFPMMWRCLLIAIAFCGVALSANAQLRPFHGGVAAPPSYTDPCDVGVTCAEAWCVDYAMTRNYTGPYRAATTGLSGRRLTSVDYVTLTALAADELVIWAPNTVYAGGQ